MENNLVIEILDELKELSAIPLKIRIILNDFVFYMSKVKGINSILLFGSYSKLIFSDKSDIDIAVIYESKGNIENKAIIIADRLSKEYKKNIHVSFFSEKDLKQKKDSLIKDILRNSKKLN